MKKTTKCTDCEKKVDFVTALSTGLCNGCKKVFCSSHKFKHLCEELKKIEEQKKQEQNRLLEISKTKKSIFSFTL